MVLKEKQTEETIPRGKKNNDDKQNARGNQNYQQTCFFIKLKTEVRITKLYACHCTPALGETRLQKRKKKRRKQVSIRIHLMSHRRATPLRIQ